MTQRYPNTKGRCSAGVNWHSSTDFKVPRNFQVWSHQGCREGVYYNVLWCGAFVCASQTVSLTRCKLMSNLPPALNLRSLSAYLFAQLPWWITWFRSFSPYVFVYIFSQVGYNFVAQWPTFCLFAFSSFALFLVTWRSMLVPADTRKSRLTLFSIMKKPENIKILLSVQNVLQTSGELLTVSWFSGSFQPACYWQGILNCATKSKDPSLELVTTWLRQP